MVNLGGGGVGVSIRGNRDTLKYLQKHTQFRCRIDIESEKKVVDLDAKLVHISSLDTTGLYLGLHFMIPDDKAGKQLQNQLAQYATWLQRQQLRRRRA